MIELPKKPSGKSKMSAWLRVLWKALKMCRPKPGAGYEVIFEEDGWRLVMRDRAGGAGLPPRWTKVCVDGEEKWAKVQRSKIYDELPEGVEEPTE